MTIRSKAKQSNENAFEFLNFHLLLGVSRSARSFRLRFYSARAYARLNLPAFAIQLSIHYYTFTLILTHP